MSCFLGDINSSFKPSMKYSGYVEGKWREEMQIYIEGIDLSVDGKILMECTNGVFEYFASVLRKKYKNHSLSKTLHVTISE